MTNKIPNHIKNTYCNVPDGVVIECPYYINPNCPESCGYAIRLKKGIKHNSKVGMERFYEKYPNWDLGIGAMTERPRGLKLEDLDNGGLSL